MPALWIKSSLENKSLVYKLFNKRNHQAYRLTDNLFAMFVAQPRDISRDGRRPWAIGVLGSFAAQGAQLAKGKTRQREQEL